jgi:hypothetical protein
MGFGRAIAHILRPRYAVLAVLALGAWQAYELTRVKAPPALDEPRRKAADDACWQAVEKLPGLPPGEKVAVLRLAGDRTGYVTGKLREVMDRKGRWKLADPSRLDTVLQRLKEELKLADAEPASVDAAVKAGRWAGTEWVLYGRIDEFTSDRGTGRIRMELRVASVLDGNDAGRPIVVAVPPEGAALGLLLWGLAWPVLLWIGAVAALPLATLPIVKAVLARESNAATFVLLIAYALAAWVLAFALAGFQIAGWLQGALLLVAFVAALGYDYGVFSVVENRR